VKTGNGMTEKGKGVCAGECEEEGKGNMKKGDVC
jgi:hypothetical protein